jgi:hypothetical protein
MIGRWDSTHCAAYTSPSGRFGRTRFWEEASPAVLTAACLGGFWPGLLATVVSTFGATYFLVKPPE